MKFLDEKTAMNYPEIGLSTLEALYCLGERVCREIERSRPDIVVGLAHSGWMPVRVAQALWAENHMDLFPPTVRTNIGQEKHAIYQERFKPPMPGYCCIECCGNSPDRLGHYLAWVSEQRAWLEALRAQVEAVYPGEPERILVVDDLFGGHRTCYLALGMLEALYPAVRVRMIAGDKDLTNNLVTAWLLQFVPSLAKEILELGEPKNRDRYRSPWHERLKPLITGSEDVRPESLEWQPVGPGSAAVQALAAPVNSQAAQETARAAPEIALAAPEWAAGLACGYALQRMRGEIPPPEERIRKDVHIWRERPLEIEPIERLLRQAWLQNGVTRQEVARVFAPLPGGVAGGLKQLNGCLRPHGQGKGRVYFPDEADESWVLAYDRPDPLGLPHEGLANTGFGEFIPGRLWAGAYPPYDPEAQARMLADLLRRGVRRIVDLTWPDEVGARRSYEGPLQQANQEVGVEAERVHRPLRFRAAPARREMTALLEEIRGLLDGGLAVYLHAGANMEGRAPMVLACWLVEAGQTPQAALERVTEFWLETLPYLIRLPLTERQRRFVERKGRRKP